MNPGTPRNPKSRPGTPRKPKLRKLSDGHPKRHKGEWTKGEWTKSFKDIIEYFRTYFWFQNPQTFNYTKYTHEIQNILIRFCCENVASIVMEYIGESIDFEDLPLRYSDEIYQILYQSRAKLILYIPNPFYGGQHHDENDETSYYPTRFPVVFDKIDEGFPDRMYYQVTSNFRHLPYLQFIPCNVDLDFSGVSNLRETFYQDFESLPEFLRFWNPKNELNVEPYIPTDLDKHEFDASKRRIETRQ